MSVLWRLNGHYRNPEREVLAVLPAGAPSLWDMTTLGLAWSARDAHTSESTQRRNGAGDRPLVLMKG
jgi:hypothetical protein